MKDEQETNHAFARSRSNAGLGSEWERGYYCAVAALLREEGHLTTAVRSLYAQGGNACAADAEDKALFVQHGLMPNVKLTGCADSKGVTKK